MAVIPESSKVVVDYLRNEFAGDDVESTPMHVPQHDTFRFCVQSQYDGRYWLEVTEECLEDFSNDELDRHLRLHRTATTMRASATNLAVLTRTGIASNRGQ